MPDDDLTAWLKRAREEAEAAGAAGFAVGSYGLRLVGAVEAVLKLHAPSETFVRSWDLDLQCGAHAQIPMSRRTATEMRGYFAAVRECPDCTYREKRVCSEPGCRDEDWPCPTNQAITRELLGEGSTGA